MREARIENRSQRKITIVLRTPSDTRSGDSGSASTLTLNAKPTTTTVTKSGRWSSLVTPPALAEFVRRVHLIQ
jgi:hypothetical protein